MRHVFFILLGGILLANRVDGVDELQQDIQTQLVVAVGSTNPVKIQAVKNAFMDEEVRIVGCQASSHVRSQPLSDDETRQGALNRAKDCLEKSEAQLTIGLEAGVVFVHAQVYLCHWGAMVDRRQNEYFTNGPLILLPKGYQEPLLAGQSLEDLMHHSTGIQKLGSKEGAIGVFTCNFLNREQVLTQIVKALIGQYRYYQGSTHRKWAEIS